MELHTERSWKARAAFGALVALIAIAAVKAATMVRVFGQGVPQPSIERDYLAGLVFAALLGASILAWPVPEEDRLPLLRLWGAKCVVALGFMLFYEWHYGAYGLDAFGYFTTTRLPAYPWGSVGIGLGTENTRSIAWLHRFFLPDSYHAVKVSFAMMGFIGVYLIYRAAVRFLGRSDVRILYTIGLFPSVLFWSSILGKDPVQLLGIAIYIYGAVGWLKTRSVTSGLAILVGIVLSMFIRMWSGPIFLVPLVAVAILDIRGAFRRAVAAAVALGLLALAFYPITLYFRLESAADILSTAEGLSHGWEGGSSTVEGPKDFGSVSSLLAYAPIGIFTTLFRPLPGEVRNVFGLVASIENVVLMSLVAVAIARARRDRLRDPVVRWALLLVFTWSVVYGFTAYNLGSVVRFKLQILPLFLLLLLYLGQRGDARAPAAFGAVRRSGSP